MSRVVLIIPSATYRATDFMAAATHLGLELVVASDRKPTLETVMGDRSQVIRLDQPEQSAAQIAELHARLPFDAVLGIDDQGVLIAALTAARLGLPHSPVAAVAAARDKALTRRLLTAAGLLQPSWAVLRVGEEVDAAVAEVGLPCVVKPLSLAASRGVIRVDSLGEAKAAVERVRAICADDDRSDTADLLIESFVGGEEVAVEALARGGRVHMLAIFDKPDPLEGPYFEETIYVTPSRHPNALQDEIIATLERSAKVLGIDEGPIHAEFRLSEQGVVTLELAARSIGGLCSRALRFGAGVSLEELILRHALGLGLDDLTPAHAASGVMMIPIPRAGRLEEVRNLDAARSVAGIEGVEITIPRGENVVPLPEGDRYLGFIFAAGSTPEEIEAALREAHEALDIDIA